MTRYAWEKKISQKTIRAMEALLPDGCSLRGIAVQNDWAVEGALIRNRDASTGDMEAVDVWQDIMADACRISGDNTAIVFPPGSEAIAAQLGVTMPERKPNE